MPIGNVKTDTKGTITPINFGRYSFDARYNSDTQQIEGTGKATMQQSRDNYESIVEIDLGQEYNYVELTREEGNTIAKSLGDFITKAKESGGYYIGRYEAGKVEDNTNTFNIKKDQEVYNEITQPNAANLARNLYSSNNNFESDLINSYAWDTATVFIQIFSGDSDYSKQNGRNTAQDILLTGESILESDNKTDVRCNIYDMAGNVWEWSTETCTNDIRPCTCRGGSYYYSDSYTAYRNNDNTSSSLTLIGFRSTLYL